MGLGWRRETARLVESRGDLRFTEVVAEQFDGQRGLPHALQHLVEQGIPVIPHGIGLSIGDAKGVQAERIDALCLVAERLGAPLVSEHVCLVRAGGRDSGHLLPLPRSSEMLDVLCDNVSTVMRALPVPLALENVATLFQWPDPEFSEAHMLAELHRRTGVGLLLDLANLHANRVNHGCDAEAFVDALPVEAIAYCHVAGGRFCGGRFIDTHADPIAPGTLKLLSRLMDRGYRGGVLLERDENFVSSASLNAELDALAAVMGNDDETSSSTSPQALGPQLCDTLERAVADSAVIERAPAALVTAQERLLTCLVDDGPVPDGFSAEDLAHASRSLANKRAKDAAKQETRPTEAPAKRSWLRRLLG